MPTAVRASVIGGEKLGISISEKFICSGRDCVGDVQGDDGGPFFEGKRANDIGCGFDGGELFSEMELARSEGGHRRAFSCPSIKEIFHRLHRDLNGPRDPSSIVGPVNRENSAELAQVSQTSLEIEGTGYKGVRHELAMDSAVHYSQRVEPEKVSHHGKELGSWGDKYSDEDDYTNFSDRDDGVAVANSAALMVVDTEVASPLLVLCDLNGHGSADCSYEDKILFVAQTLGITSDGGVGELRQFTRQMVEREKGPTLKQMFEQVKDGKKKG